MLISKYVEMKWNSKNKKRYEDLGYIYTKMKDSFLVIVEHLPDYSRANVTYVCDYCETENIKSWEEYNRQRHIIKKDCCSCQACKNKKLQESMLEKYGETNISRTTYFKDVYKDKMQNKYGVDNYFDILNKNRRLNAIGKVIETDEDRISQRKFPEYKEWRRLVFEKDNYICQICGDRVGGNLVVHHKDGYEWCKERRTDITNGITLCDKCHNNFHKIFGYGANTEKQFHKFALMYFTLELSKQKYKISR